MSRRKIVSMRATGASRGTVRSPLELTGDALVPLNDVVFERGSLGAAELLARLRPTCEPLVRGVIEWAGSEEIRDLAIRVHVEGPSFPVKFQTRFCTGSGDGSRWHDLDSWERTLKDQLDAVAIEGATIDPSDGTSRSTLTDGLLTGLAGALGRF